MLKKCMRMLTRAALGYPAERPHDDANDDNVVLDVPVHRTFGRL